MVEKKVQLTGNQLIQMANQEKQKLAQINDQVARFQEFKTELLAAKDVLTEIEKNKKGDKILINLGAGVYMNMTIDETSKAISSLSGNVFKEKNSKELIKVLDNKIKNMNKTISKIAEDQQKAMARVNQLEQVLNAGRQHTQKQRAAQN
ncbi:MAG: prefoldin subunit alpha [Candidatus Diapherotrites archaeon]|uniref:Prefoldin subunit alpha n=1 Tax=Candidatus Iainarchaeum sp. TaxID=3101447 RepID=A0A2D6LQ64_9ARCH|nr:prefoldin subunit alpha [Candidatus Diapherotrites archaeon]|tara:strand:- start:23838 stop:24284 length:447 start_codon:yes stop_codon:yes gene_type:complete